MVNKSNLPLILLAGIGIFLVLGLQVAQLLMRDVSVEKNQEDKVPKTGDTFKDMVAMHPKKRLQNAKKAGTIIKHNMPTYTHNIVSGNPTSKLVLTVFDDPSCGRCRKQINQVLRNLPTNAIKVVRKFYPVVKNNQNGGLFRQVALKNGAWPQVSVLLRNKTEALEVGDWSFLLEDAGLSLKAQRHYLAKKSERILFDLQKDLDLASKADITRIPTFYLNNMLIDGRLLTTEQLSKYIKRLQQGKPILSELDLSRVAG